MAKVELKAPIVDEIKGYMSDAKAAVLVDYRGLTVEQDTRLRKQLREAGVVYKVYKNTMLHLAFDGTDYAQLDNELEGPTAIAFGIDGSGKDFEQLCQRGRSASVQGSSSGRNLLRRSWHQGTGNDSIQGRSYFQAAWQPAVTDGELRSCG